MGKKRSRPTSSDEKPDDGSDSFSTYFEYNRVLRTWFVAFGVGGPALFLVNETIAQRLAAEGQLRLVVILFLIGAGAQVLGALLNKVANWYVYWSIVDDDTPSAPKHAWADWLARQFWIDVVLDVVTIAVFGWAAWLLLTVFAS
jgi:hypothetical protein